MRVRRNLVRLRSTHLHQTSHSKHELLACTYLNECELEALLDILAVRYARRFLYRVGAMGTSKELAA